MHDWRPSFLARWRLQGWRGIGSVGRDVGEGDFPEKGQADIYIGDCVLQLHCRLDQVRLDLGLAGTRRHGPRRLWHTTTRCSEELAPRGAPEEEEEVLLTAYNK